jgi:secondary thiamine-phosphate synthase enzyme
MKWHKKSIQIKTNGKGLYSITDQISGVIKDWQIQEGMCFLFLSHTSASLTINESFDPTARQDLEEYFERKIPEDESWYRHTSEGSDDSSSHIRTALTQTSMSIPIDDGGLFLGTWQGIYLFEHRARPHNRNLQIRCLDVNL